MNNGFSPGRPVFGKDGRPLPKIKWASFKIGDIQYIPMDTSNKALVHSLGTSYYSGAKRRKMSVSISISDRPGHMAIWRVK
jgi:hypothetical protein